MVVINIRVKVPEWVDPSSPFRLRQDAYAETSGYPASLKNYAGVNAVAGRKVDEE